MKSNLSFRVFCQLLGFACLFGANALFAQDSLDRSSPRATVRSHLYFLQPDSFQPSVSARTLFPGDQDGSRYQELARQLKQIYDGEGFFVDLEAIPDDLAYTDSAGKAIFIVDPNHPNIYVERVGGVWLYSRSTVAAISQIHAQIYPFGTDFLVDLIPGGERRVLGMQLWKWIGILLLLAIGTGLLFILRSLLNILLRRLARTLLTRINITAGQMAPLAKPLAWLLTLLVVIWVIPVLLLPVGVNRTVITLLNILVGIFGVLAAYRLVGVATVVAEFFTQQNESKMDDQLVPLVSWMLKAIVIVFGVIFILQNLDVNVTALLAGVSIGGLALALAAQDTVKNFIGSISIFVDQPFQVGDFIETKEVTGSVKEVGVRSTRIQAVDGAWVTIPNGTLANLSITNHTVRTYRRYATNLTITYGTPVELIEAFASAVRRIVTDHPETREEGHIVQFVELADSSLNIFMAVFIERPEYNEFMRVRQELFTKIVAEARTLGVDFAFPSRSLYVEQMPEPNETQEEV